MSTTDPTGEGGGGGGGGGGGDGATTPSTNVEQNASPSTPISGTAVPTGTQQQQHPPPSPLSGCYLLVVLPEPHTAQHKDLILNRLAKGFLSWDKDSCHVDLEKELLALVTQAPEGEEARNGERLIQYATENLVTEVLIHPQTNTLLQCIRNLLASFTKHRHIIHAGYTFGGNGSWILQDGTFSLADFLDAFSEHEVQRVLRAYENSVTVDIHCAGVGDWLTNRLSKEACCRSCRVRVNPDDVLTAGVPAITNFTNYIGQYLVSQTLDQLMEPSDVVGNIRFSHPTLYVFPGGQGDAALFGINGFNMLVDGGFARKACFWDFTRHLDRLDAVLVTRINNSNIGGMFSVLRKKKEMHVYPQIGHFFCNLVERRQSNSPDGDKDIDPLILNLTDIGQEMVLNLRHINLRAHPCYRDPDPINLYHKVGHGTLDMYVLSPSRDSREVREFLVKWHASDSKLFAGSHKKDTNNLTFPIQNLVSICALLVWQPANPEDTITRILFPGSTPQHKIFEGFERLKHLDFLKHPVCSAKTLSPSTSLATLRDKPAKQKFALMEKEPKKISEPKKDKREPSEPKSIKSTDEAILKTTPQSPQMPIISTGKSKVEIKSRKITENKKIENESKESKKIESETKESKKIEKELKEIKKEAKRESAKIEKSEKREENIKKTDLIKSEPEKTVPHKEPKLKPEPKKKEAKEAKATLKRGEATPKPKPSDKKAKLSGVEKKDTVKSSPTTPKKTLNGTATKTEISKAVPKTKQVIKAVPSLPAKSAKEANNRKVVEQKNIEKSAVKDTTTPAAKMSAKPKPIDRKPISRRTKPVSPNKVRMPGSPAKSTRSTPTTSVKSDKDGVIRRVKGDKGTTDSSTVSTPSGIEIEAIKPIDKSLIEQSEDISLDSIESKVLADLKEEREVVEEIEAVLQKAERIEETRFEGDDEITAEATDKKEEDMTEEDVTAEIEDAPKKEGSRKESQELTEEDEYLIVEKEEMYTEDSAQSGEGEQKHVLDEAESEKAKALKDVEAMKEKGEKEASEKKEKDESREQKVDEVKVEKESADLSPKHKQQLQEEVKEIIASAAEIVQKTEEKDDSGKKDSEDITKEPSSLSPDKLDSSEKKTTDTDIKPDIDQKEQVLEKMEESQERISTIESGATTTAPTLPEDERIPLDEIKEDIDEKHVIEEVKEKEAPMKLRDEIVQETVPAAAKPDVKIFDVRQTMHGLQRDIVKTPDEVADLPVHEEVDPKLYRMEDFEKGKEEKSSPQEIKEPPTPPKEQKGVFSFFGKVADKFEKGIDKLTKKTKKDGEKDSDEKSSSKSSSPKEPKEKTPLGEADMEKMFPKVGKPIDKPDTPEEAKPIISDVKEISAIKETVAFMQEEILDHKRQSVPDIEEKFSIVKLEDTKKAEVDLEVELNVKDISPAISSPIKPTKHEIPKEDDLFKEEDIGEDAEEVKALLEEASKKFKTVKDSLRDSLESLDEKIKEEEMIELRHEISPVLKDAVKDTLEGVVEKLEEIKPHTGSMSPDIKEPEKVKFDIPKDEEFEEEYEEELEGPFRNMREAVRDVGEVLAGTAGIDLDKPKDVVEIVKKVAEVLKEDDFLSHKVLFEDVCKEEEVLPIQSGRKPSVSGEKEFPQKVSRLEEKETSHDILKEIDITKKSLSQEEIEELIEHSVKSTVPCEKADITQIKEEPCVKVINGKGNIVTSPVKDAAKDKMDAQKICEEMLKDDHICVIKKSADDDTSQVDVMQAGIECVCVKEVVKRSFEDKLLEDEIEQPVISFDKKISPGKAELVMVTPDSTPTSPKFITEEMYDQQDITSEFDLQEALKLPEDIKEVLNKEIPVAEIIEELIITKKKKITIEVIEYITIVKRIPRERVIYIIEEIIVKKGLSRENVVDDPYILKLKEPITSQKRMEIEEYIVNEYIVKGKRITIQIVEEISIKKIVPKKIVIEIIEEIIIKRKIARHMVLDISEEVLSEISKESPEKEEVTLEPDLIAKRESIVEFPSAEVAEIKKSIRPDERANIEQFIVNEYITKGHNITIQTLEEICNVKQISKKIIIEIIEEIIIKKKIPRNEIFSVTEEELLQIIKEEILESEPDLEEKKSDVDEHEKVLSPMLEEEDTEEEKLVDGFVNIPRKISDEKIDVTKKDVSPIKTEVSSAAAKDEKDTIDDFEAVEQEYKVRDIAVTSPDKADEVREKEDAEEAMEDTTSEVIEADEKFVQETKEKIGKEKPQIDITEYVKSTSGKQELEEPEMSELSEVIDATEKYLDEAKEKTDDILPKETITESITSVSEKVDKSLIKKIDAFKEPEEKIEPKDIVSDKRLSISEDQSGTSEAVKSTASSPKAIDEKVVMDEEKEIEAVIQEKVEESKLTSEDTKSKPTTPIKDETLKHVEIKPEKELADATGFAEEKVNEYTDQPPSDKPSKIDDGSGTVKRMLVTASSEDGREETEICPTGSITFTKIVTPDDSLKDASIKSTPDKDSLPLDKDSLRSGASTPEKDSISERSAVEGKDKITPEDSLDKSPVGTCESQDLKDTLEKSEAESKDVKPPAMDDEKSKLKRSEQIEKIIMPKSPTKEIAENIEKSKIIDEAKKPKSPTKDIVEKLERSKSPMEDTEKIVKSKSPSLPIEGIISEIEKEISKTPDSLHSEDASPAETIFSKSPTDKHEMSFVKTPISEEDIAPEIVNEKLSESIKELSPISLEKEGELGAETKIDETSTKHEIKESIPKPVSPVIVESVSGENILHAIPTDKSRSSSVSSIKSEKHEDTSSVASEKFEQDVKSPYEKEVDKSKLASAMEKEMISEKPSNIESEHYDEKGPIDEARSPSVISDKSDDEKKEVDRSKSPSIAADKPDFQDITECYLEKAKSPIFDRPESPKTIDKTEESQGKDRSPSVASDKSDRKVSDRSRSPSICLEKPDLKDTDVEKPRSPSIASEKADMKDIAEQSAEKSRSPSVISVTGEQKESTDLSKSSSIAEEKPDMKDVIDIPLDKSRSSSVASVTGIQKETADRSRSPSVSAEKSDIKDVMDVPTEKSRSSSLTSVTTEHKESIDFSKSPSIAGEALFEKSRTSSIVSTTDDQKESIDRSKSPSITGERADLADVAEEPMDKSKSPSIASIISDQKETAKLHALPDKREESDRSKSPSVASDKFEEVKSGIDSKPSSVTGDIADLKDVEQPIDKSRSSSVVSVTKETTEKPISPTIPHKTEEFVDRSKSPSIASDKSDEKDDKASSKERYEDAVDKSPSLIDMKITNEKEIKEKPLEKLDIKEAIDDTSMLQPHDKPRSPDTTLDKPMIEKQEIDNADIEHLRKSSIIDESDLVDKTRSLSIISDKTEPKSSSDISKSPSLGEDKIDQKDKSGSSSVASERLDDIDTKISSEMKKEPSVSPSSEIGKIQKDESAKSSRASSPVDKTPKDRSRSQSVFDAGEKTPASRSRTSSLYEDKLSEKLVLLEEKDAIKHIHMDKPLDEKDEHKSSSKEKSPVTSPEMIQKELQKIREKRFADFEETDTVQPTKIEKSDDEDEDIVKVTAEKKAEIEKYILEEYIIKKRKISLVVIEKLVMTYSVPQFIIMEIIEDIISRQKVRRSSVFDFIDDDMAESKYEEETEVDLKEHREKSPEIFEKGLQKSIISPSTDLEKTDIIQGHPPCHGKLDDSMRTESPDDKVSPIGSDQYRDTKALSASPSLSPEPIDSDKSTQDSLARSEPHIDEEILVSEEKRMEIEKLLEEEYIKKGRKITEIILENIIIKTSLPRYIILEIVEEIITKMKIPRESVIDVELHQEEEPEEDYHKIVYHFERTADRSYELPEDAGKSTMDYRTAVYPESHKRQMDKSITDYPMDYESQFHKAFVGGITEIRTTHITTLSGKSTPEFAIHDGSTEFSAEAMSSSDKISGKLSEQPLPTTHIRKTDIEDLKVAPSMHTVTILRDSKIAEPHVIMESSEEHDEDDVEITKVVKSELIDKDEHEESTKDQEESEVTIFKKVKRLSIEQDEPDAITKIIKREIVEHEEPEMITKIVKREIIEQDEPEIVTKVIRHEVIIPDEEMTEVKEDSDEFVKTITTKTTRTIVTEELSDTELSQTDPSKIYTDPTSGTIYKVVSEEDRPEVTSADVKRIVTTVTTITGPDGKVTTKKDVTESSDIVDSEEMLEKLIDSSYSDKTDKDIKPAEKIIKETITNVTSGTSTSDMKTFHDSDKSTLDSKREDKSEPAEKDRLEHGKDKLEDPVSTLVRDLISDDKSYSGKSSPDISLPKDIIFSGSTGKSTPEVTMSPLIRDGAVIQSHLSGRSTPDRKSEGRSLTGTPEGFRSGEVIRTIITTTKTISDEGEIVTTTREVTETTNEKGETVVVAEKTDVKVDERLPSKDAESAISGVIGSIKSTEGQRSDSPESDDITSDKDRGPSSPLNDKNKAMAHMWGSGEEKHTYSDDEPVSSSLSSASQIEYSPQSTRRHEPSAEKEEKQIEFSASAMSSSFYGELPAVPPEISAMKTFHEDTAMQRSEPISIHSRLTVEKEFAGGYAEKPDAKRYVDEADLDFDKALMEHKDATDASGAFSSGIAPRYTNGSLRHELTEDVKTTDPHPSSSLRDDTKDDPKGDSKKDPLSGWGTPLGLPSPKPPRKFNLRNPIQPSCSNEVASDNLNFDVIKDWGEPLRLPSPAPVTNEISNKGVPGTPKKERKQTKKVQSENIKNKKRSESPGKNEKRMKDSKNKIQPVYMDLAYVPHHGNSYYTSLEFFKKVRARYYVFSGTEPSREVYDALLEAKKTWEDKNLEVTMIPTYDTDTLGYWVADNEEALAANHIDLSPSASRCTINLQDHETSCSAYRLEF